MVDLNKIAANLVNFVEGKVAEEKNTGVAGRIDTEKGESVFKNVLDAVKSSNNLTDDQVNEIWGFAKGTTSNAPAKAPMKAAENSTTTTDASDGINITINDVDNWYINVNVDLVLNDEIKKYLEELVAQNAELNDQLKTFMTEDKKYKEKILAMLKFLCDKMTTNSASLENIEKLITNVIEELEKQGENIEDIGINVNDIRKMIEDYINDSLEVLQMMGFNLETLINLVKESNENDKKQLEMLNTINQTINALTQNFENFSEEQIALFNKVIGELAEGNESLENIMRLLELIKASVDAGNTKILETLENHGEQINVIIDTINADYKNSGAIKQLLTELLKKEDIDNKLLKEILDKIENMPPDTNVGVGYLSEILNKMDTMTLNQDVVIMILKGMSDKLDEIFRELRDATAINALSEQISNLTKLISDIESGYYNKFDEEGLMNMLKTILDALKEGQCTCNCGTSNGESNNNEGIVNDLENIFKAKGHTGVDNPYADSSNEENKKFINSKKQLVIRNKKEEYGADGTRKK